MTSMSMGSNLNAIITYTTNSKISFTCADVADEMEYVNDEAVRAVPGTDLHLWTAADLTAAALGLVGALVKVVA